MLEADLTFNQLLFEYDQCRFGTIEGICHDHDAVVVLLERGLGVTKIEALRDLFLSLQERVAELGPVYFGDHVEGRHGARLQVDGRIAREVEERRTGRTD